MKGSGLLLIIIVAINERVCKKGSDVSVHKLEIILSVLLFSVFGH